MKVQEFLSERHVEYTAIPHRDTYDAQRLAATVRRLWIVA